MGCAGGVPIQLLPWFPPPADAWLQSVLQAVGQPGAVIPMAQGASAPALAPACTPLPPRVWILYPVTLSPPCSSLQPAGRTWLPTSLQMGSSRLWNCTGTGLLECPVWANTSDFG